VIERKAHDGPHAEIQPRRRRDPGETPEQDGEVDFAPERALVAAAEQPDEDGCHRADEECPDEGTVEGSGSEEAGGADDAPED